MSKSSDKYFVLYGSIAALLESYEDDDDEFFDAFDELLSHAMLIELNRRSL